MVLMKLLTREEIIKRYLDDLEGREECPEEYDATLAYGQEAFCGEDEWTLEELIEDEYAVCQCLTGFSEGYKAAMEKYKK